MNAPASLVRFPDRSFVDQSAHKSFREKIQVTLWYFSTARTSRSSRQPAPASLVRFPDRSFAKSPVRFLDLSFADSPLTHLSAKILQVTSPSWPIASRCRCLSPRNAPASLVRFPDRSVRLQIFPRKFLRDTALFVELPTNFYTTFFFAGDIAVFQHTPKAAYIDVSYTGITGEFPGSFFRGPNPLTNLSAKNHR